MTENNDSSPEPEAAPNRKKDVLETAKAATDTAKTLAEGTSNAISAIKWVAMAIVALVVFGMGYAGYKIISAPAKAVGKASQAVSESVKSGASSVMDGTSEMLNRLIIPSTNQPLLNTLSEQSFEALTQREAAVPETMKERLYWAANLSGHENRVCEFNVKVGEASLPILMAADNKDYETSKSMGSNNNRLMRIVVQTQGDDVGLNVEWDEVSANWVSKWKATTIKKPLEDIVVEQRLVEILSSAATDCR